MGGATAHEFCSRILVIAMDILYLALGAGLLGIGIWLRIDGDAKDLRVVMNNFLGNKLADQVTWVLIGVGVVVICIAVLGLVGALFEKQWILGIFAFFLLVLIAAQVAACVLAGIFKEDAYDDLAENMEESIAKPFYEEDSYFIPTDEGLSWNFLQWQFECCGAYGVIDYGSAFALDYGIYFPYSCCVLKNGVDGERAKANDTVDLTECERHNPDFYNSEPCYNTIIDLIEENAVVVLGITIGLACFTLLLFVFTICLCVNTYKKSPMQPI